MSESKDVVWRSPKGERKRGREREVGKQVALYAGLGLVY